MIDGTLAAHRGRAFALPRMPVRDVLLVGPAVLERDALFDADGEVTVRGGHVCFEPSRLARWSGPEARRALALRDLQHVSLHSQRRRLEIVGRGQSWRLRGPMCHRLFCVLRAVLDDGGLGARFWEARAPGGRLSAHGILSVSSRRVSFVLGRAAATTGAHPDEFDLPHACLTRVRAEGRLLHLRDAERERVVELSEADVAVDVIARWMLQVPYRTEVMTSERGAYEISQDIRSALQRWGLCDDELVEAPPRIAGPVVAHSRGREAARYDLVLAGALLRLLPPEGPAGGRAVETSGSDALGPAREHSADATLVLRRDDGAWPIVPRGGARFVRDLWRCVSPRTPSLPPDPFAAPQPSAPGSRLEDFNRRVSHRLVAPEAVEVELTLLREVKLGARGVERVQGETYACALVDVSAEGLGVTLRRALPAGAEVLVRLRDDATHFLVPARVVHVTAAAAPECWRLGLEVPTSAVAARGGLQRYWAALQRRALVRRATRGGGA